jgi:hypothetical protein
MNNRIPLLAALALSSLLLCGCAGTAGSVGAVPAPPSAAATSLPATHGGHHDGGTSSPRASADGPSEAAKMVCGDQPPATPGPEAITRNALAYQLSTTILACWVEHH